MIVVRLISRVDGTPTRVDGQYVVNYSPTFDRGAYQLETTPHKALARFFTTFGEAHQYVMRVSPNVPFDSPGHPNRPIRAYTIAFEAA